MMQELWGVTLTLDGLCFEVLCGIHHEDAQCDYPHSLKSLNFVAGCMYAPCRYRMLSLADKTGKRVAGAAVRNCLYLAPIGLLAFAGRRCFWKTFSHSHFEILFGNAMRKYRRRERAGSHSSLAVHHMRKPFVRVNPNTAAGTLT